MSTSTNKSDKLEDPTKNQIDLEKSDLNLAVIGNCSFNALINSHGRYVWCCLPRFDSPPMFSRLVSGDSSPENKIGFFDVIVKNLVKTEQSYLAHSAILETKLHQEDGSVLQILDFAPRFVLNGRIHSPTQFVRILKNLKGCPQICIRIRPVQNYGESLCSSSYGSNHISYFSPDFNARVTTDVPVDFITTETWFLLNKKMHVFFGNDEPFRDNVSTVAEQFFQLTNKYWRKFSKELHIPLEWQDDVIRAAITLKMCQAESSGAIIAAMTSSIPEASMTGRNWDYRFCWLRDSYHIIQALNELGATCTMENYLNFLANILPKKDVELQPLYGILMEKKIDENFCKTLKGYRGQGPVRIGNSAYFQKQNDNYGNIILSIILIFYDERVDFDNYHDIFEKLEALGEKASKAWCEKDAGLWELRGNSQVHTFSSVMCWVCCDRLGKIAKKIGLLTKASYWNKIADNIKKEIYEKAWDPEEESFMATLEMDSSALNKPKRSLDASVLLLAKLLFVKPKDERFVKTVRKVEERLIRNQFCFRYVVEDDFGKPENSFIICTFWFIDALCHIGEYQKAREMFENLLKYRNHVGLFSEDIDPDTFELWGNFPQAYSLVGIINTAATLSRSWKSVGL